MRPGAAVHLVPGRGDRLGGIGERTDLGVGVSINFICKDALAIYRQFTARGLAAKRPFVGNGMWVTQVIDPDGYQLYFESPTDVAEETVFSDAR